MKATPRASGAGDVAKHGAELFAIARCASCHTGTKTTDGAKHKVDAAGAAFPGGNFATPSLRFVAGTGPYFHGGRYRALRALLTSDDSVTGKGKDFPAADIDALQAYLETL